MIKANIKTAYLISKSKKDFICFNLDNDNKILKKEYILTNDLTRHRLKYQQFRLIDIIKKEINTIKFN